MHQQGFCFVVVLALVGGLVATGWAASAPRYQLRTKALPVQDETFSTPSGGHVWGTPYRAGATASPGTEMGLTYWDAQHLGSVGRQVGKFGNNIQVSWMDQGWPGNPPGHAVKWNRISVTGSPANYTLDNGSVVRRLPLGNALFADGVQMYEDQAAYTTMGLRPNGRAVLFYDAIEATGGSWVAAVDQSNGSGVFAHNIAPQPNFGMDTVIWPSGVVGIVGPDTVVHVVGRGSSTAYGRIYNPIFYWRGRFTGATITWSTPIFIDSTATLSHIVEADPTSNELTILYTRTINFDYTDVRAQEFTDLILRKSTDGGTTWHPPVFIVRQDTLQNGYFPYTDVAAVYDPSGALHVLYNARTWQNDTLFDIPALLMHWSDILGTSRVITSADWINTCSQESPWMGGAWNLQIAKPSIAVKPAGEHGLADELLYAVWVQFGPTSTDCATKDSFWTAGGYVNGEIYYSASSNDGLTWDRPTNITGTETPDCNPGDCHSEHWVSAAPRADSGVYISYVDDTHAGALLQGEGVWSESPYLVYAFEARPPAMEPRINVWPTRFVELNVKPESTKTVLLTIQNLGNAALNYDVNVAGDGGGWSHVQLNGGPSYSSSIAAAGAPEVLTISYDGVGISNPSERDWRIEVTSNDSTNNPGVGGLPIDVNLNVYVADPWFTCGHDTISTGQHRLTVGSCLELGDQGDNGGFFKYSNESDWLFDASPVVAWRDGPYKRAYVNVHFDGAADRSRDSNESYRAQSAISVFRGAGTDSAKGTAYTTDSLIQLDYRVRAFKAPNLNNGFVVDYKVTNISGGSLSGIHLGAAADIDVDSSSSANDGIASSAKRYVGARGGYLTGDTAGGTFIPQNNYAALFFQALDGSCAETPSGGKVLDNVDYLYPEGEYNTDSLYDWMSETFDWGSNTISADTPTDVNVVLVNKKNVILANNASTTFAFGFAVSDVSDADLELKIAALREAANPACTNCPIVLTGDVDRDTIPPIDTSRSVTSSDVIWLVNYVFKSGSAPDPCIAAGDVNCSGAIMLNDILYLVNYVFKGGAAPCNACTSTAPC